jgi:16S rRNA (guanine527-N7)-methyltransferase
MALETDLQNSAAQKSAAQNSAVGDEMDAQGFVHALLKAFPDDFSEQNVSRETVPRLQAYLHLLQDWQTRINLVGPATLPHAWRRHMLDSAQLYPIANAQQRAGVWLDLGSGAGFPALVLAVLGVRAIHLVEATTKKCRFLEAASKILGVDDRVVIHNRRIETLLLRDVDVITARACAPLDVLFAYGVRFAGPKTLWLLPKGQDVEKEIAVAHKMWDFKCELVSSVSDQRGHIIAASSVKKRRAAP